MFLNQLERRMEIVHGAASKALREKYAQSKAAIEVNRETMDKLQRWLHNNNSYYLTYKALAQINPEEIADKVLIILKDEKPKNSEDHVRQWNLPTCNEVAIIDLSDDPQRPADIRLHLKDGTVQQIKETHRSFQALHYTLLFPYGDDNWHPELRLTQVDKEGQSIKFPNGDSKPKYGHKSKISPSMHTRHRLMDRDDPENDKPEFNSVIRGGRLFQEYCCGMHFLGEKMRLDWFKNNQQEINAAAYGGLVDAQNNEESLNDVQAKIILPPSHIGSPRWYTEKYQGKYSNL